MGLSWEEVVGTLFWLLFWLLCPVGGAVMAVLIAHLLSAVEATFFSEDEHR